MKDHIKVYHDGPSSLQKFKVVAEEGNIGKFASTIWSIELKSGLTMDEAKDLAAKIRELLK